MTFYTLDLWDVRDKDSDEPASATGLWTTSTAALTWLREYLADDDYGPYIVRWQLSHGDRVVESWQGPQGCALVALGR